MTAKSLLILIALSALTAACIAQESPSSLDKITNFPGKFFSKVNEKAASLESKLDKQAEKYLQRLLKKEKKLQKRLQRKDSAAAAELFGDIDKQYASAIDPSKNQRG